MRIRSVLLTYLILLHLVLGLAAYYLTKDNVIWFFVAEIVLLLSLFFLFWIYRLVMRPLKLMQQGLNTIKDEDFSVLFRPTSSAELNELVNTYNALINKIREERQVGQEKQVFMETLIGASSTGLLVLDYDGRLTELNKAATKLLQLSEDVKGKMLNDIKQPVIQAISKMELGEVQIYTLNGLKKYRVEKGEFYQKGFPRGFYLIEDLSKELFDAEKTAYEKVIRMMAHEVNNTIGAVNSVLDSAISTEFIKNNDPLLEKALQMAYSRNGNMNTFMKNFASLVKIPEPEFRRIDIYSVLKDLFPLVKTQFEAKAIEWTLEGPSSPVFINADSILLEQVFINILKNSVEAIGEEQGAIRAQVQTSPFRIRISDNGCGIPSGIEKKIFSPFFSTKISGQGIGLALIRDILHKHNLQFNLKTDIKTGWTHFDIFENAVRLLDD